MGRKTLTASPQPMMIDAPSTGNIPKDPLPVGKTSGAHWLLLVIILGLGAFFRFAQIGGPSLFVDEIWSIEMSMGQGSAHDRLAGDVVHIQQVDLTNPATAPHWWNIWTGMTGVPYPPLYHIVLRWWMDLFGNSTPATRALSAVFSLGATYVLFDICRLLYRPATALLAAALMALSPAQLDFAQQTRSYAMLILLALACADVLVRIEAMGASRRRLALLALLAAATMLTHYFGVGALLGLGAYTLIRLKGADRRRTLSAFGCGALLFAMTYGVPFYHQVHSLPGLTADFLRDTSASPVTATALRLLSVPGRLLLGDSYGLGLPSVQASLLLIAIITVAAPIVLWASGRRDLLLWILWFCGTIGFVAVWDILHGAAYLHLLRYSILASPAIYAMIAALDWPPGRLLRSGIAIAALVLVSVDAVGRQISGVTPANDWRQFAGEVEQTIPADDLLVFYNDSPWLTPGVWYMGLRYYSHDFHHPWVVLYQPASARLLDELQSRETLWLIGIDPVRDHSRILPGWRAADERIVQNSAGTAIKLVRDRISALPASNVSNPK